MDCGHFGKNLDNYENLTKAEKMEMSKHAAECKSCGRELDFMLSIIETTKSLPKIEPPSDFMEKLNLRIDMEERKKRNMTARIAANVHKNWRQYTAAAACLALVAVITSNGMSLVGKMTGSDDGVIYDETQIADNAAPMTTPSAVVPNTPADNGSDTVKAENSTDEALSANTVMNNSVNVASAKTTASPSVTKGRTASTSKTEVKTEINTPAPVVTHTEAPKDETISSAGNGIAVANLNSDVNSIAAHNDDNHESDYSGKERNVPSDYSLADSGELMIARYEAPEEGEDEDSKKAIGKIKISTEDIDEAMDVIMQYSHDVSGDFYMTDSANLSLMFSSLIKKGVNYTNYTPAYEGNIKFQLVIE